MLERARHNRNPFDFTEYPVVERIFDRLTTLHRDEWARAFGEAALPHEERARLAEAGGDAATARAEFLKAYGYWRVARYPHQWHPRLGLPDRGPLPARGTWRPEVRAVL
jgi:hypothetical protein